MICELFEKLMKLNSWDVYVFTHLDLYIKIIK